MVVRAKETIAIEPSLVSNFFVLYRKTQLHWKPVVD